MKINFDNLYISKGVKMSSMGKILAQKENKYKKI